MYTKVIQDVRDGRQDIYIRLNVARELNHKGQLDWDCTNHAYIVNEKTPDLWNERVEIWTMK